MKTTAFPVLILVVLAGCRMYGAGDGADAIEKKIGEAAEQSLTDYDRARADRDALLRAAEEDASLQALAEQYARIVELHFEVVERHLVAAKDAEGTDNLVFRWVGPDRYRRLHREYGGLITARQIVEDRYRELTEELQNLVALPSQSAEDLRLQTAPHFYRRAGVQPSISDILAARP